MKYTKLGSSGLEVSRICLGCMSFGEKSPGAHDWSLDEASSRPIIEKALDLGINFFDTANAYSRGSSEEITGRALRDMANRDEVVIATKVYFPIRRGRNARGLSPQGDPDRGRRVPAPSGHRLHRPLQIHRWDDRVDRRDAGSTHHVVTSGKVRYIGASSMWAWQFSKALYTSEMRGFSKFISMQNQYSLLQREEEREMLPLCADQGIGDDPVVPLGRGLLTRDWEETTAPVEERSDDREAL